MMTLSGKTLLKRYLVSQADSFVRSIAVGVGSTTAADTDTELELEIGRYSTTNQYLFNDISGPSLVQKLLFKTELPPELECKIYEVAVYSYDTNPLSGNYSNRTLCSFTSDENWQTPTGSITYNSTNSRVGGNSIRQSSGDTHTLFVQNLDLSGYSVDDDFVLAGNLNSSSATSANIIFSTLTKEIAYTLSLGSTAGYKIVRFNKDDNAAYDNFEWGNVNQIKIQLDGGSTFDWDTLRVLDSDTNDDNLVMVARTVLASPITKSAGVALDIQYEMEIGVEINGSP